MSTFLIRRLTNQRFMVQCRGIALSSLKGNAKTETNSEPRNTPNVQSSRQTALYDFHVNSQGRM